MLPFMKLLFKLNEPIKISDAANIWAECSNLSKEILNQKLPSKKSILKIEFLLEIQIERSFHIYKIDQDRFDEDIFLTRFLWF